MNRNVFKLTRRVLVAFFILTVMGINVSGRSYYPTIKSGDDFAAAWQCLQRVSDTISDLWLVHTNRMVIGRAFENSYPYPDDDELTENLPFEFNVHFPASDTAGVTQAREYLYAAGLWVGGIKGDDTLVSQGFDYQGNIPELNPTGCAEGQLISFRGLADMEHTALAYDTIIVGDTIFRCQTGDCNDWYPLGIKVASHSYSWASYPYNKAVFVEYRVTNIDSLPLSEGWVGIYADCDIGSSEGRYKNDVSGFIDGAFDENETWVDLNVAYSHDLLGDPGKYGIDENSSNGAWGVQVLGLSVADYRVNYNWWVEDDSPNFEFAPLRDDSILRDLGGSIFTAYGDSNKYYLMSNAEVDYNQIESGLYHTGWRPGGSAGRMAAKGGDTRFLISAGPFDLQPGEEVVFTVAYIAGADAMFNHQIGGWFDPQNSLSVADYYELLNLDQLKSSAIAAHEVFKNGFDYPLPSVPQNFRLTWFSDDAASFAWRQHYASDLAGYYLLEADENGLLSIIDSAAADDTTIAIYNLIPGETYTLSLAAFDAGREPGQNTAGIKFNTDWPHPPENFTGFGGQGYPVLKWSASPGEIDFYRLYRSEPGNYDPIVVVETSDTLYVDVKSDHGLRYRYFVTSVDLLGRESVASVVVELVPMELMSGILAINHNRQNIGANFIYDDSFFDSLLEASLDGIEYDYLSVNESYDLKINELSQYSLLIISAENMEGSLAENLTSVLPIYLSNGGKVIFILRHAAIARSPEAEPGVVRFGPNSFFSNYLKIDSSFLGRLQVEPGYLLAGDMIGAQASDPNLPDLVWDSALANSFGYGILTGLPYCGHFWPQPEAEPIYTYQSYNQSGPSHDQINGIRFRGGGEAYSFYLFNFPLSLMQVEAAGQLLRAAVIDLDEQYICGDINLDYRFNVADLVAYSDYLYRGGQPDGLLQNGDVNCDAVYDLTDLLILVNFYAGRGAAPGCCGKLDK